MTRTAAAVGCVACVACVALLATSAMAAPPASGTAASRNQGAGDAEFDGIVDLFDADYLRQSINVARLPLRYAVTVVHGRGERVLYTFEDPNCDYCRELTRRLAAIGNVTVHTYVIALLGEDSRAKTHRVWCAPDRATAWQQVTNGQPAAPARANCRAPLDETMKLAEMLGINFTPTVFFADGSRMVGLKPRAEIEQRLRDAATRRAP